MEHDVYVLDDASAEGRVAEVPDYGVVRKGLAEVREGDNVGDPYGVAVVAKSASDMASLRTRLSAR